MEDLDKRIREIVESGEIGDELYDEIYLLVEEYGSDKYWEGRRDGDNKALMDHE